MSDLPKSIPIKDYKSFYNQFSGWEVVGHSVSSRPIYKKVYQSSAAKTMMILSAVHGDETEGASCLAGFIYDLEESRIQLPENIRLVVIPIANPDGFFNFTRGNANGVDLNRNLPTKDWTSEAREEKYNPGSSPGSEPENKILLHQIDEESPSLIISLHSWKPLYNVNGEAHKVAQAMHAALALEITEDIGYPTPGSLGTYCGLERNLPTITWELQRGLQETEAWPWGRKAMLACLEEFSK
jgi:murein peptide amidase A